MLKYGLMVRASHVPKSLRLNKPDASGTYVHHAIKELPAPHQRKEWYQVLHSQNLH